MLCSGLFTHIPLCWTPWTVACQAPLSMGFSRQEYWNGLPYPYPGNLSNPGIECESPELQANSLSSEPPGKPQGDKNPFPFGCLPLGNSESFLPKWEMTFYITSTVKWKRKWQPTPVLLSGTSHDRRAWKATVYGVAQSQTQLSTHTPTHSTVKALLRSPWGLYFSLNLQPHLLWMLPSINPWVSHTDAGW